MIFWIKKGIEYIEFFLGEWNDILYLLSILINIILSIIIFKFGQAISIKKDCFCFLTVINEIGLQYENLERLNYGFSKIYTEGKILIEKHDIESFFSNLYNLKIYYSNNWVSLPLHKLNMYQGLFDQYGSKYIRLCPHSKKVNMSKLNLLVEELQKIFKDCVDEQDKIKNIIPNLSIFFNTDNDIGKKIDNLLKESKTFNSFKDSVSNLKDVEQAINWIKTEEIMSLLKTNINKYSDYHKNAKKLICNFCKSYNISQNYFHMMNYKIKSNKNQTS